MTQNAAVSSKRCQIARELPGGGKEDRKKNSFSNKV
jgi:hypothetical protein